MTRIDVDPKLLDRALLETKISAPIYTAHIENIAGQPATLIITTRDGTTTLPIKTGTVAIAERSSATAPAIPASLGRSAKPNKVGPLSPPPADGGRPDQPPSAGKDTPLPSPPQVSRPDVRAGSGAKAGRSAREGSLAEPRSADDLTVISGVGQGYARRLHQVGIHTFEDLQTWVDDPNRNQAGIPGWCLDKIRTWLSTRT